MDARTVALECPGSGAGMKAGPERDRQRPADDIAALRREREACATSRQAITAKWEAEIGTHENSGFWVAAFAAFLAWAFVFAFASMAWPNFQYTALTSVTATVLGTLGALWLLARGEKRSVRQLGARRDAELRPILDREASLQSRIEAATAGPDGSRQQAGP